MVKIISIGQSAAKIPYHIDLNYIYYNMKVVCIMVKKLELPGLKSEYTIDEDGNIFDVANNRYKHCTIGHKGYVYCSFYINGRSKNKLVHRLVLMTFNPMEGMENLQVNHIDGNKKNNNINNLEWCTPSENVTHAYKLGLMSVEGTRNPACRLSENQVIEIANLILEGHTIADIRKRFNVSKALVSAIRNKRLWGHLLKDYDFPKSKYSNQK